MKKTYFDDSSSAFILRHKLAQHMYRFRPSGIGQSEAGPIVDRMIESACSGVSRSVPSAYSTTSIWPSESALT